MSAVAIVGVALLSLFAALLGADTTHAIGSIGPDQSMSGSSPRYVLVKSDNTGDMSRSEVPIYLTDAQYEASSSGPTLNITSVNCVNNNECGGATYDQYVELRYKDGNGFITRTNAAKTVTLNKSLFKKDKDVGLWKLVVVMQLYNGASGSTIDSTPRNRIMFRLNVSRGDIGSAAGNSRSYVNLAAANPNDGETYTYTIPFASDCSVTSSTKARILLTDLDSQHEDNAGKTVTVTILNADGTKVEPTPRVLSGGLGDGETYEIEMNYKKNGRYYLRITGINSINMVQYRLPMDDINFKHQCDDWKTSAVSKINGSEGTITVKPNDVLKWRHTITNNGPAMTNDAVTSFMVIKGFSNGWNSNNYRSIASGVGTNPGGTIRDIPPDASYRTQYTVKNSDVGNTLCQSITYSPRSGTNSSSNSSTPACAKVAYNYNIIPVVSLDRSTARPDASVDVSRILRNTGDTKSEEVAWRLVTFTVPVGKTMNITSTGTDDSNPAPNVYYEKKLGQGIDVSLVGGENNGFGTKVIVAAGARPTVGSNGSLSRHLSADLNDGDKVCWALSARPYKQNVGSETWRYGTPVCVTIIDPKAPMVHVSGGDLVVGRSDSSLSMISTNMVILDDKRYASWTEYGVMASGSVTGMGSALGYAGGVNSGTSLCTSSKLTFSNTTTAGGCTNTQVGNYALGGAVPDIAGKFPTTSETIENNEDINTRTPGSVYTTGRENLTLPGTTIGKGRWYVINAPNTNVTISGDITYDPGKLESLADIPQLVIIAKNIYVASGVKNVDAWLLAPTGTINTCGSQPNYDDLTKTVCSDELRVNGPVIANKLYLRRTAGEGKVAAEVFNLRPDAYMWASYVGSSTPKAQTVLTTELPPRY